MKLLTPTLWKDYELIDTGNFEKLERFGEVILIRPEPQAVWDRILDNKEWTNTAHARFVREQAKGSYRFSGLENGGWTFYKKIPENWIISYDLDFIKLKFKLSLTTFGHIGIFPEQAENWNYIYKQILLFKNSRPKVLNLFAYTGGATLAAKAAGADVTHVDAVKSVVNWSRENMDSSGLKDIRWIVEDALKFVKREVRRENIYQGIIIDPPAYGRGPKGEKWVLEENLNEILKDCSSILDSKNAFLVLNLYSLGFSSLIGLNVVSQYFNTKNVEFGEFYLASKQNVKLPLGTFLRLHY